MRKRIKFIVEIVIIALYYLVIFNDIFHVDSANPNKLFSPYAIIFHGAGDNLFSRVMLIINFIFVGAFIILLVLQLIFAPIKRTLYYISIATLTIAFLSFTLVGFVLSDMSGLFYLVEGVFGLSLIGLLSFELLASKGL